MKTMKRALAVLLAAVLLCIGVPFVAAEDEPTYQVGDQIQFGTYPQTRVDETPELQAAAESATWKSYNYYTGTGTWDDGLMTPSDYMKFADFFCDGIRYRAVMFEQYRPSPTGYQSNASNTYQDDNGYEPNNTYFFKYEPLIWRVLDPSEGYIMCESIIDCQAYQNTVYFNGSRYCQSKESSVYANDYASSSIRTWLNFDFFETAFSDIQKANIKTIPLDNRGYFLDYSSTSTNDKIFLVSYFDVGKSSYGFSNSTKAAQGTDYAQCQGLGVSRSNEPSLNGNSSWYLRSAGQNSDYSCIVSANGDLYPACGVNGIGAGIRPACVLLCLEADATQSEYLFSAETYNHSPGEGLTENVIPATCKTAASYESVTYCTICGEELSRETIYVGEPNPDAHNPGAPVRENEQPATCKTAVSYESVIYCTLCGEELSRETVYEGEPDPEAHDMQIHPYVASTCTEGGYAPFVCSRCGYTIKTDPDPALGHDYNIVYTWAKDDSTVTAEKVCSRCGDVALKEVADVTAEVTVKPTCSTEGELTLIAAFNNKAFYAQTKTKVLPMDPDAHVFRVTVTPPTCLDDGYTTHACTLCRYGYSDEIVAALGHDYVNAKATGNGDGTHTLTCNRCKQPGEAIACADVDNDGKCDFCGDQMQGGDHCKYCGRIHNGNFFDKLTGFFHKIFAVFKR